MKSTRVMVAALAALGLGGGWLWLRGGTPADSAPAVVASSAAEPAAPTTEPAAPTTLVPGQQPRAAEQRPTVPRNQRARADAVRAQLRQQLAGLIRHTRGALSAAADGRPVARASTRPAAVVGAEAPAPRMPAAEGEGNQAQRPLGKYIHETLQQQFVPLAGSCYEQLLQRDPAARGKLVLDLEVVGDPSTGGVVNDVTLAEGTTFNDEEFATCVSESLYSTVFDAPPDDEKSVTITYPIELEP